MTELTFEQQQEEFIKCARDPVYFLETYGKVKHPLKGIVPFKLYDFQRDTLHEICTHRHNIILKARQLGLSTLMAGRVAHLMIFQPNREILVVAIKQGVAINFIKKVKVFMRYLPDFLKPKFSTDNQQSVFLANGSSCTASTSSDDAGRSEALSLLILDEAAFIRNIEELWTAVYPTLSTGGAVIALSTPNGQGNWFHKTYKDAENGLNDFKAIKLMWDLHPERDEKWYNDTYKNMGYDKRKMAQEHECDFISSGSTVIDPEAMQFYKSMLQEPKSKRGPNNSIWRWKDPVPGHKYLIVADTARGDGTDFSAYEVIDLDTFEQVEEFKYQVTTTDFADLLVSVATTYNRALLAPENNGVGWAVVTAVANEGYGNLYYSEQIVKKQNPFKVIPDTKKVPGFTTSTSVRPLIIDALIEGCNSCEFKLYSKRLLDELETFVWFQGKPQAMSGYNDDVTLSLSIGMFLRAEGLKYEAGVTGGEIISSLERNYHEVFAPYIEPRDPSSMYRNFYIDSRTGLDFSWILKG